MLWFVIKQLREDYGDMTDVEIRRLFAGEKGRIGPFSLTPLHSNRDPADTLFAGSRPGPNPCKGRWHYV